MSKHGLSYDWLREVNKGRIQGHSLIHKFGRNAAAGTSEEDIHYGGGALVPLTAAVTIEAISASAADAAAGAGARTIQIWGLDINFEPINEVITMNGIAASTATTQSFLRVFKVRVLTTGTYNAANTGDITVRVSSAGATQVTVEAESGVSQTTHYTIPAGFTAYVVRASIDVDSSKTATIKMVERGNSSLTVAPFDPHKHVHTWSGVTGNINEDFVANHKVLEKQDIWFEVVAGSVGTPVEADYDLLLIDNEYLGDYVG